MCSFVFSVMSASCLLVELGPGPGQAAKDSSILKLEPFYAAKPGFAVLIWASKCIFRLTFTFISICVT